VQPLSRNLSTLERTELAAFRIRHDRPGARAVQRLHDSRADFDAVPLEKPADVSVIVGQSHFIKTVEDLHEVLAGVSGTQTTGS
jgi:hypothetical protein